MTLNVDEHETLTNWARRPSYAQGLAQPAQVILACAEGKTNTEVAREIRATKQTVGKWRNRFLARRTDGLFDQPRPGAPRRTINTERNAAAAEPGDRRRFYRGPLQRGGSLEHQAAFMDHGVLSYAPTHTVFVASVPSASCGSGLIYYASSAIPRDFAQECSPTDRDDPMSLAGCTFSRLPNGASPTSAPLNSRRPIANENARNAVKAKWKKEQTRRD